MNECDCEREGGREGAARGRGKRCEVQSCNSVCSGLTDKHEVQKINVLSVYVLFICRLSNLLVDLCLVIHKFYLLSILIPRTMELLSSLIKHCLKHFYATDRFTNIVSFRYGGSEECRRHICPYILSQAAVVVTP